ncbi:olfactory receptor 52L1-like [Aquarana catesbeiana]|uniref:olfactory receptor 52L1-like n=1 Tax=Aquarana catesbeiana TaxID=8400 RepID=UPI003CC9E325
MVGTSNSTFYLSHHEFTLLGFPGVLQFRRLLFIPFLLLFIIIILINSVIIHTVRKESSLHAPMYVLISLLSITHICGTTNILPKMLLGILFGMNQITLIGCLIQMFFIYFFSMMDCNVLLMMALDRYIAICKPLSYHTIMTRRMLVCLTVASFIRGVTVIVPVIYLASTVNFSGSNTIHHFACEHMALLGLACSNVTKNKIVGLSMRVISMIVDLSFLSISYGTIICATLKISTGTLRKKAMHTCGTHALVILVVYFFRLSSSVMYRVSKSVTKDTHNLLSAAYLLVPALANPLIYGLRTNEIRVRMLKTFSQKRVVAKRAT